MTDLLTDLDDLWRDLHEYDHQPDDRPAYGEDDDDYAWDAVR